MHSMLALQACSRGLGASLLGLAPSRAFCRSCSSALRSSGCRRFCGSIRMHLWMCRQALGAAPPSPHAQCLLPVPAPSCCSSRSGASDTSAELRRQSNARQLPPLRPLLLLKCGAVISRNANGCSCLMLLCAWLGMGAGGIPAVRGCAAGASIAPVDGAAGAPRAGP